MRESADRGVEDFDQMRCRPLLSSALLRNIYIYIYILHLLAFAEGAHWKLILYADGITPGSVLAADNQRKSVAWYVSFLELGRKLSYEECWLALAVARTIAL